MADAVHVRLAILGLPYSDDQHGPAARCGYHHLAALVTFGWD